MRWLKSRATNVAYRVSGLPVSLKHRQGPRSDSPAAALRHIYARRYWRVSGAGEALDLGIALLIWPFFILIAALWHCMRIGPGYARRSGRSAVRQFADQLRLWAASGVMPASYYVFSLYEEPTKARADAFLKRSETKGMIYGLVRERAPSSSSLADKGRFEERCRSYGLPTVPTLAIAKTGALEGLEQLPYGDLFVKPLKGKGGRGAERWTAVGDGRFRSADGTELDWRKLSQYLARKSQREAQIIQPAARNHPSLDDLNCGALATVRVLTCMTPAGAPELIGAAMRMAISSKSVVDNFHSGGIAAAVDCETGVLGPATNLGLDPRIDWLDRHPVTGAIIAGRKLEWWGAMKQLALDAHRVFADRVFVGWDLAMTGDGPAIVEANGSPDLDILQRCSRTGMANSKFTELLLARLR